MTSTIILYFDVGKSLLHALELAFSADWTDHMGVKYTKHCVLSREWCFLSGLPRRKLKPRDFLWAFDGSRERVKFQINSAEKREVRLSVPWIREGHNFPMIKVPMPFRDSVFQIFSQSNSLVFRHWQIMLEKVADSARKAVKLAEQYKPYGGQLLAFCSISLSTYQTCLRPIIIRHYMY